MTYAILEVPHRGAPLAWIAYDLDDYTRRTEAAGERDVRGVWDRRTVREMLELAGETLDSLDPDDELRYLAAEHGLDTPLYRAGWITGDEWQVEPIDYAEACDAYNGSDLSGFWRVPVEEADELLDKLEGPNAPRVGKCGPVAAAAALRRVLDRA